VLPKEIMMPIYIRIEGDDSEQELRSFNDWLTDDPHIRRCARVSLTGPLPGPGEMGSALDVIQLVIDDGFQAASLALAYVSWRSTRPTKPSVTIEHGDAKIVLSDVDPETIEQVIQILERNDRKR
jgi:hypothetical protein